MSSPAFRQVVLDVLAAQWAPRLYFDLSDYVDLTSLPATGTDPVLLVQFIGGPERLATIATRGADGWEEEGIFYFHLLMPTGEPSQRALTLGEEVRAMFRGKRFGSVVIEAVDPFTDFMGAAIRVSGKWHGWSAPGSYYNVVCA